ncbi:xanthine dehydrogenase YagS FAD-binding subunit [Roseateles sp. YR242]|uniref:FAD binding domain-containing protein n=1 Tax=Roseateles sp. YR242 TaxID=1855305 RepID=UPI0008B71428|nr:xanthine dehydrogenase family protein subunit M [Roseateles sp. YR242]SEL90857.1 xanthine dehydrogenase YagS FAD-binding subunit [Roseateles sp. YR242]
MNPFHYERARTVDEALALMPRSPSQPLVPGAPHPQVNETPHFIAGGTNLVDLMKEGVLRPCGLVDINTLPLVAIEATREGGLRLGALATNADTAQHPLVIERAPLLRSAILAGASPQIRNRATNGGNLLQRTRCHYFYDIAVPCNKRAPGTGCPAATGIARQHAILGANEHCVATHPSDLCVALAALDATVHVQSPRGSRQIPFGEFHRLPADHPEIDHTLAPDELITHLTLPPSAFAPHSCYLKLRERASYAFALVSVAAALVVDDAGRIMAARIALGGVAHKPWRDESAEALLVGQTPSPQVFDAAAQHLLRDARPWGGAALPESLPGNAFKIPLARRAIVRALTMALAGVATNTGEDFFRAEGDAA